MGPRDAAIPREGDAQTTDSQTFGPSQIELSKEHQDRIVPGSQSPKIAPLRLSGRGERGLQAEVVPLYRLVADHSWATSSNE